MQEETCTRIDGNGRTVVHEFSTNHEEANTKIVYHLNHAIENDANLSEATFVIKSNSGDVDVPLYYYEIPPGTTVSLDSGRDKFRQVKSLGRRKALLGVIALTGCDQNSSFLRKGKLSC